MLEFNFNFKIPEITAFRASLKIQILSKKAQDAVGNFRNKAINRGSPYRLNCTNKTIVLIVMAFDLF